ncbi:hypothetical protein AAG570_002823 [Ranatra chinensis]|uniref:Uncharacterized protein n=1 Tax=Ranatra chinensis TaxID=642074 RepID=A0ABD0Y5F2_9HEMI
MLDWLMQEMGWGGRGGSSRELSRLIELSVCILQCLGEVERSPRRYVLIRNTLNRLHLEALERRLKKLTAARKAFRDETVYPGGVRQSALPQETANHVCTCDYVTNFVCHKLGLNSS